MKKLTVFLLTMLLLTGCAASAAQPTAQPTALPTEIIAEPTSPADTEAAAETVPPTDPIDELLSNMSLREKVGQLFITRPEQLVPDVEAVTAVTPALTQALTEYPLGGILLFGKNIQNPQQLMAFTEALAAAEGIPMFLAVDEEGGLVARLANNSAFGLPRYGSAKQVGLNRNPADALEMGQTIGGYLKEYGFNLDFAPVADVFTNPNNTVIGSRAFSSDPETAALMASAFRDGLSEKGMIGSFKHFPGHGDTAQDSHTGLAVSSKTLEELESCEFLPFLEATAQDMVMVGHIALPNVTGDLLPATLSPAIVTGILKEQLGFEGLVITDAMEMGAIVESYGSGTATVMALQAGCHLILVPQDLQESFDAVLDALDAGTLTHQWLEDTVRKILEFKTLHGLL